MSKYYIFITFLGVLVLALSFQVFSIAGTPFAQQNIQRDSKRLSDFIQIKTKIEDYYNSNKKLPADLSELKKKDENLPTVDAQSKKQYDYQIVSGTEYKLCTEFLNSYDDYKKYYGGYYSSGNPSDGEIKFGKGYSCISYSIPSYYLNSPQNIYIPSVSPAILNNASTQFAEANNTKRKSDILAILNAVNQYMAENKGLTPPGITATTQGISSAGSNLCAVIVTKYIAALPRDPKIASGESITDCTAAYDTGYTIFKNLADNRITIMAPLSDLGEIISVTR